MPVAAQRQSNAGNLRIGDANRELIAEALIHLITLS
jgi:hypothetical protein